ncbi:hypothetical protein F5Y19DRAFT_461817 [Xylariaceae sp. FL1651]|nr:hypothetical protein F5Y19DRAFT_461817 [Xylariaceae sp. FL1651]
MSSIVYNTVDFWLAIEARQDKINNDTFTKSELGRTLIFRKSESPERCPSEAQSDTETDSSESVWLSDFSEDITRIDSDSPLFYIREEFLPTLMEAFINNQKQMVSAEGHSTSRNSSQPADSTSNRERAPNSKSKQDQSQGSGSTDRSEDSQKYKTCKKRKASGRQLSLACPFAKKDPVRHRHCYRYILTRIRDVKQHLARCHRMPLYCPRCMNTFENESDRDLHIRSSSCAERPLTPMEGISEDQKAQLSRRVSSRMPEAEQWFTIFEILFPGHPRPRSPYIDLTLSEEMHRFRDFFTSQGPYMLSEFLQTNDSCTWMLPPGEQDLAAFQASILADGFQLIFDRWNAANAAPGISTDPPDNSTPSRSGEPGLATQDGLSNAGSITFTRSDTVLDEPLRVSPSGPQPRNPTSREGQLGASLTHGIERTEQPSRERPISPHQLTDERIELNTTVHEHLAIPSLDFDLELDNFSELANPYPSLDVDDPWVDPMITGLIIEDSHSFPTQKLMRLGVD